MKNYIIIKSITTKGLSGNKGVIIYFDVNTLVDIVIDNCEFDGDSRTNTG
jgi:hypothetical protein